MITPEIISTAVKTALCVINTGCVCFICITIGKWLRRLEDKVDELDVYVKADVSLRKLVRVELLKRLRDEAIKRNDFKSVMEMQRLINEEKEWSERRNNQ